MVQLKSSAYDKMVFICELHFFLKHPPGFILLLVYCNRITPVHIASFKKRVRPAGEPACTWTYDVARLQKETEALESASRQFNLINNSKISQQRLIIKLRSAVLKTVS
jgi:hypothetical protein